MDASKITELLQKQNTRYIDRSKTVDSSTMIWMNQIQSSKYIKGVATCTGLQNTNVPTQAVCPDGNGNCSYGGQGKQMALTTGSTQRYPSVFAGAVGSASQTYSSDAILLQKAGRHYCAELITEQDPYTVLPVCYDVNTNGPTKTNAVPSTNNNQTNPYLPPFDTYYKFKNQLVTKPVRDQNLKHFVKKCYTRFPGVEGTPDGCVMETEIPTKYGWPIVIVGSNVDSTSVSNSVSEDTAHVYITGYFTGTINLYNGGMVDTVNSMPVISLSSGLNSSAFIASYNRSGRLEWATTVQTEGIGNYTIGFNTALDATGIYVLGTLDGTIEFYNSIEKGVANHVPGLGVKTLTTQTYGIFLAKYDVYGTFQWASLLDHAGQSITGKAAMSTLCTTGQYVYVVSYFYLTTSIYNKDGSLKITLTEQSGGFSGVLIQYSIDGTVNWVTQLNAAQPNSAITYGTGIAANGDGVYITGFVYTYTAENTFNYFNTTTTSTPPVIAGSLQLPNNNIYGIYVMNYATAGGAPQWITTFDSTDSTSGQMYGTGLSVDMYGLYYIGTYVNNLHVYSASSSGPLTGQASVTLANVDNPGNQNVAIVKIGINNGNNGKILWTTTLMDNQGGSDGFSIKSDGISVYVSGSMTNAMNIYTVNNTTIYPQSPNSNPTVTLNTLGGGDKDAFLIRYDIDGTYKWMTIIGSGGYDDVSYGVYSDGVDVTITGFSSHVVNFYNATTLTQPSVIGATFDPSPITTTYAYIMAYSARDGTVIKLK